MPTILLRRLIALLAIAAPSIAFRFTGFTLSPVLALVVFGVAVVAASFILAWAAEAAQKDISGALAIAILALIAVLPEYAIDLYYAFRSGTDPQYEQFAAANMTGSNRLLLGLGWPLIIFLSLYVAGRAAKSSGINGKSLPRVLHLPGNSRLDVGVLAIVTVIAIAVPIMARISLWVGALLILAFVAYLWRASRVPDAGEEEFIGMAAHIADMPRDRRRTTVVSMFIGAAAIILSSAEPFAEALIESGHTLGIDSFLLVQWLAPLASEAPEFIIAVLFALRGMGAAALGTLIASKINQWTLLVGSLPIAHYLGGGGTHLSLNPRQVEEFVLTASQTVLGVSIIIGMRVHRLSALALVLLFAVQFAVPDTTGRYILSGIHLAIALVLFVAHRRAILPALATPFRRNLADPVEWRRNADR